MAKSAKTGVAVPHSTNLDTLSDKLESLSFDELVSMLDQGVVTHIQDLDDTIVYDKADLVGKPMVITKWHLNPEGNMGEFVVCRITTPDGHGLFTDGSTGIKEQLKSFVEANGSKPIYCPTGLRVSNYTYKDPFDNKDKPAQTYYLSNS